MKLFKSLVGEIEVLYKPKTIPKAKINCSDDAATSFRKFFGELSYKEKFFILHLNRANNVLGHTKISEGGLFGTFVDPKMVFGAALVAHSSSIILCHNHASQNLRPSQADFELTKKIKSGGEILSISVLDHIILSEEGYYSFADEGQM